ncbi:MULTISPECIES: aldo/keto reductase [unclassified Clostridioides]|uniref:aldo/keto reductase n=1 Tax=unclassified Clostridioides TaxID=2635829 RepID=UPI001D1290D1|nr:aldo/keto reductase [Clostridioides sp. ZZV14-6150]MCC0661589.1 aldo/keto reductase [Clostridioides sp. ZZV14-6154]MCC0668962.1 aldo/keto reductase [Clostridioides sp. ZZV14-6153]MCC0718222.1 aldo/keto reductase [Clostridioides sp. ZZV14-6105]MCC0721563.1 aldo/keto reductase [Clostridioides sp. ZZV14-6104]MCC0728130.1 aldo/keto reductase [Clostridioides sp. ZZV14-6045]MCC0731963.1 aldo/keto reductase [Clostridioides sp. ZZV14-6048]MCC0735601.1 aldo/keto reductase [Clostridioides sp. ZZV14
MEYVELSNGVKIPKLGFGVFQITKEECEKCVLEAISVGYRHIDTAQSYFNEEEVGNAISKCGLKREELFITTKVWIDNYGYEKTKQSILQSMRKMKVDYIDLVLLHQPFSDYYGAYHALEDLYEAGKIRAIGVSNFSPDRLADIASFNKIAPHVNQVETNPFNQQVKAQENMIKRSVQIEAWAPFGEGKSNMFQNPVLKEIADKHDKSIAQVILRWLMQRDIVALAKSTHIERMKENFEIFDFQLSDEDMCKVAMLDTNTSLFFNHQTPETVDMFVNMIEERKGKI